MNRYFVYIMTNQPNGTLYIGFTGDLAKRVYEHKTGTYEGFTSKYELGKLVYFEETNDVAEAIKKEKQLKKWNRDWKINLIEKNNPDWNDLYENIV